MTRKRAADMTMNVKADSNSGVVNAQRGSVFGCMKDEIQIVGDIVSSAVPAEDWDVVNLAGSSPIR